MSFGAFIAQSVADGIKSEYSFTLRFLSRSGYFMLGAIFGWFSAFIFTVKPVTAHH